MSTLQTSRVDVAVTDDDLAAVRSMMGSLHGVVETFSAHAADGTSVELPREVSQIVRRVLAALSDHGIVTVGTMPAELTSNTAAGVLGISRPTILKLAREGELASFKVGTHTRFRRDDVLEFKQRREASRRATLEEILAIGDQLDEIV